VTTPFTLQQFFDVFASYNAAIWPAQIVAYVLGLAVVATLGWKWLHAPRFIAGVLALMWLWNGVCYHWLAFSPINHAATVFAVLFVVQAVLLTVVALAREGVSIRLGRDFRSATGFGFIVYALLIYPALGLWAGHGLMAGPMFGVAPCPTTIFTIGLLLLMRGRLVAWLSVIPLLWSLVGLAAALQLGMIEDLALPVAGLVLVAVLAAEALRARRPSDPFAPVPDRVAP
jgi:Family of unknown function (DUF6064)